jgi:G6PDH family F420-dependent oxidoreductase
MPEIGYAFSSEEHLPNDLVRHARLAEEAGFTWGLISDHFHPWHDEQGQSPFVWSVIGGIAQATERFRIGTGVTCPLIRIHPAIVAQAAATSAAMMGPGRFFLGVGTGENLNEHVTGVGWPAPDERVAMLAEAIEIMRELWQGEYTTIRGDWFEVDGARLYTLPEELLPIVVAAGGEQAAQLAARSGDGLMSTSPESDVIKAWEQAGGSGPKYGQVTVCWNEDEAAAKKLAYEIWPNAAITGQLSQDLPTPTHFEQAAEMVSEDDVAQKVVCGPDPGPYVEMIDTYRDAGYDHLYLHQVGPDQQGFLRFWRDTLSNRV